jgi:3-isopropylmalate dehydrogenase
LQEEADAIKRALEKSLTLGITTEDIKGKNQYSASTSKVGGFIADYILNQEDSNMNFMNIHAGQSTII